MQNIPSSKSGCSVRSVPATLLQSTRRALLAVVVVWAVPGIAQAGLGATSSETGTPAAQLDAMDCVLNWAERAFKDLLPPDSRFLSAPGYRARCYASDTLCLGAELASDSQVPSEVYLFASQSTPPLQHLGAFAPWAATAQCAGSNGPIDITQFERPYEGPSDWTTFWPDMFNVFRTQAESQQGWLARYPVMTPELPLPSIDFRHYALVGVATPACGQDIVRVRQNGDELVVQWRRPTSGQCIQAHTADFVLIPRTDLPVRFERVD